MCGIIGYTGTKQCVPILIEGLTALEYRGYDSAGVAFEQNGKITSVKAKGRLSALEEKLDALGDIFAGCGIGHTRWATHGEPSDTNSHPHCTENLALVHNGIIENYSEIEEMLSLHGYTFESETDTERAAKLIDLLYLQDRDPLSAIIKAKRQLRGSFAFGIMPRDRSLLPTFRQYLLTPRNITVPKKILSLEYQKARSDSSTKRQTKLNSQSKLLTGALSKLNAADLLIL